MGKQIIKQSKIIAITILSCLCFAGCELSLLPTQSTAASTSEENTTVVAAPSPSPSPTPTPEPTPIVSTVTFSASGDNLIHKSIYEDAATYAQQTGSEKAYDFSYAYENIASFFENYDVNWLNQETLITATLEPSTYPCFSTPSEIFDTLYEIGFRVFSISNNHTYDKGAEGIDATLSFWESTPEDVVSVGLYDDVFDEGDIEIQEVNGISIGYLSYTFSTNGIPTPTNATKTVIYTSETARMQEQVELANTIVDVVVVSVHWGTENSHVVHSSQENLAQNLADWGADLIIGTHPHVLQDCAWLTAEDGSTAFVAYSLGNFLSAQSVADNLIGGVLTLTFQKTEQLDGSIDIEILNPQITPVVTHYDVPYEYPRVYLWSDYTQKLASTHGVKNYDDRFTYDYIARVIEDNISAEFLSEEFLSDE